jgi:TatD DNase family protein
MTDFFETHMHLTDGQFDSDRSEVIARAYVARVRYMVEIAESPENWDAAVDLTEKYSFIYASLGIHPHHAHDSGPDQWPSLEKRLRELLKNPKVVAIGEFGLDYFRMRNTREEQECLFRRQLDLARELDKPVVIHCRDAHADLQKVLLEYYPETAPKFELPRPNGVIHCFSGVFSDAQVYMMHGFLMGIDGPVTYPNAKLLQENVLRFPVERMVLETDCPYLPPQAIRGQRNDPAQIPAIAAAVAKIKRKTTDEIAERTTRNARVLFRIK